MPMSAIYLLTTDSEPKPTYSYDPDVFPLNWAGKRQ